MRIRHLALGVCMTAACGPVLAGSFVTLPTTAPLRKFGAQNPTTDTLKLDEGPQIGIEQPGNVILYAPPSNLTQLDARQSNIIYQGNKVGTLYDYVFRDATDNQLVFGHRIVLEPVVNGQGNIFEVNDFYRSGNTGFTVAAAWSRGSSIDLRMYSAARTSKALGGGTDVFDPDITNTRSDINVSEGNPRSGFHFLKSAAPYYKLATATGTCAAGGTYGFRLRQSGEEQQPITDICFDAFVPSSTAPVTPESVPVPPWALVLLAAGLALAGLRARRR